MWKLTIYWEEQWGWDTENPEDRVVKFFFTTRSKMNWFLQKFWKKLEEEGLDKNMFQVYRTNLKKIADPAFDWDEFHPENVVPS